jgi:hypothetical protein
MWTTVIQSNLHISPGLMGHVNYCHPLKPSYLTWSNGSCELLSSNQTFISHLVQWVMWTTVIHSNLHISPDPMGHVNYCHPLKPSYLTWSNGSCELLSSNQTFISHLIQWVMWTTIIQSNLHISPGPMGHVSYCHPLKPSYLTWSNGSCELLSSTQTFISHIIQRVMWAIVIQSNLHISSGPMGHVNYYHPIKPSYLTWANGSCELLSSNQAFISRVHQTRRSGRLLRLGFNEVAQFLSKSEVLVRASVFSSPYFVHQ